MATDFSWIYLLFFLIIPLARIIPRIIRMRNHSSSQELRQTQQKYSQQNKTPQNILAKEQTTTRLVLAELNRGSKTFGMIQRNTRLDTEELDSILEELEKKGLLQVQERQGFFGKKIELIPTEKGFKEYYS